jgi:hypothetical protein
MGVFIVFKYEQTLVRKEMKRRIKFGISENERLLLSIPKQMEEIPNKYFQRIHKGEFRYKGEMYDILYAQQDGDTTHYIVIHDPKETNLFARLDEHLDKYNDWDTQHNPLSKSKKELKKYKKDYFFVSTEALCNEVCTELTFTAFFFYYQKKILDKITPPPQLM